MNAAVVLAAGSSSRLGFPKQLAEVKDKPLLQSIIDKVNNNFENSSVVLGSESEIISEKESKRFLKIVQNLKDLKQNSLSNLNVEVLKKNIKKNTNKNTIF